MSLWTAPCATQTHVAGRSVDPKTSTVAAAAALVAQSVTLKPRVPSPDGTDGKAMPYRRERSDVHNDHRGKSEAEWGRAPSVGATNRIPPN